MMKRSVVMYVVILVGIISAIWGLRNGSPFVKRYDVYIVVEDYSCDDKVFRSMRVVQLVEDDKTLYLQPGRYGTGFTIPLKDDQAVVVCSHGFMDGPNDAHFPDYARGCWPEGVEMVLRRGK